MDTASIRPSRYYAHRGRGVRPPADLMARARELVDASTLEAVAAALGCDRTTLARLVGGLGLRQATIARLQILIEAQGKGQSDAP